MFGNEYDENYIIILYGVLSDCGRTFKENNPLLLLLLLLLLKKIGNTRPGEGD